MKLRAHLSIGLAACDLTETLELPDGSTPDQCQEAVREWAHEHVEYSYEVTKEKDGN